MPKTRECSLCRKVKPLTADYFPAHKSSSTGNLCKDGFRPQCIPCFNDKRRAVHGAPRPPKPTEETLEPVVEHRLKQRLRTVEAQVKSLLVDLDSARRLNDLVRETSEHRVPGIRPRERKSRLREATAFAIASDWHIEEPVDPAKIGGRNRFSPEIAKKRAARFFEAMRYAINFNRQIFKVRDCVLAIIGDIITNYLREEDVESNEMAPPEAIAFGKVLLSDGIKFLLEDPELERIVIPCIDGNHGRLSGKEKIKHRTRVANSLEWLMYTMLKQEFANEPRVEFQIAAGELMYMDVYERNVRILHGDLIRYAGGVGGVTIPIYKAIARWDTAHRADLTVMGHFHQLTSLSDIIINGSLIGYNEYAQAIGCRFEPPAQAFTMLDPLRFKSVAMPLWVSERSDDILTKDYE